MVTVTQLRLHRDKVEHLFLNYKWELERLRVKSPNSALGVSVGAWSSDKILQDLPAFRELTKWLMARTSKPDGELCVEMWGNIIMPGGHIARHNHLSMDGQNPTQCGVYFLSKGTDFRTDHVKVMPHPESLVLFAPSVAHWTETQGSHGITEPRYSIAFNIF